MSDRPLAYRADGIRGGKPGERHIPNVRSGRLAFVRCAAASGPQAPARWGRLDHMVDVHPAAWVSPRAALNGEITVGAGSRVLDLAVIQAVRGPVVIGSNVVVMEHAVLRGRPDNPVSIGDSVLVGPHT